MTEITPPEVEAMISAGAIDPKASRAVLVTRLSTRSVGSVLASINVGPSTASVRTPATARVPRAVESAPRGTWLLERLAP